MFVFVFQLCARGCTFPHTYKAHTASRCVWRCFRCLLLFISLSKNKRPRFLCFGITPARFVFVHNALKARFFTTAQTLASYYCVWNKHPAKVVKCIFYTFAPLRLALWVAVFQTYHGAKTRAFIWFAGVCGLEPHKAPCTPKERPKRALKVTAYFFAVAAFCLATFSALCTFAIATARASSFCAFALYSRISAFAQRYANQGETPPSFAACLLAYAK